MKKAFNKSILMTALICGSVLAGGTTVFAEENIGEFSLDTMVVTATRSMKQLQEVPSSVSVITAQELKNRNVDNIEKALQYIPGVYMSRSNSAYDGSILMRGMDTTNILVLVDGQQMNLTYNGTANLSSIPVESIERIEVLRGAASSIYGGHAVAGVINITTKEAKAGTHIDADLTYGSHNTWKKALQVNSKVNEKVSFGLGYEQRKSDGFVGYYVTKTHSAKAGTPNYEADLPTLSDGKTYVVGSRGRKEWQRDNYNAHIKYNFDESKSLKYSYTKAELESTYKNGFSYIKDANGNPVYNGVVKTADGKKLDLATRNFLGTDTELERDTHALSYRDEKNNFSATLSYVDNKLDGFTSPTSRGDLGGDLGWGGSGDYSSHPGKIYNLDLEKAWENVGKHSIVLGANIKQEEMTQDRFELSNWHDNSSKTNHYAQDHGKVKNMAIFVQDEYKICDPLTMYIGARFDHYKKGSGTFWDTQTSLNETSKSQNYNEISPKIAFDYKADEKTNYYISYGHSFNPAPMYKIYRYSEFTNYWYVPNPDLDPETSDTFELGMKKQIGDNTNLGVALYHIKTDDKIIGDYVDGKYKGKKIKKYLNFDNEKRKGIEFELKHQFSDKYSSYLNYAWQRGVLESKGVESNNYEIPKHLFHAGVEYNCDKWNVLLDCQYVSARQEPEETAGEYGSRDSFFLVDAAVNYKLNKDMTIQIGINNLFDRQFYCDEAADGRTYYAGVRYSF